MWKVIIGAAALCFAQAHAQPARPIVVSSADVRIANERCTYGFIGAIPGHFRHEERRQVAALHRLNGGPHGCTFSVSVWDADIPDPVGAMSWLWSDAGPGLYFADGAWQPAAWRGAFSVEVVHLAGLRNDQVLITHTTMLPSGPFTTVKLFAFADFSETILDISAHARISANASSDTLALEVGDLRDGCRACGLTRRVSLHFDRDARQLALVAPDPETIALYRRVRQTSRPRRP